jgi:hypothetical protein
MSLHHGWTLHASAPNMGDDRRIGFVMNFLRPSVRQTLLEADSALLVRGADRHGHFRPETRPTGDLEPDALARVAEIARLRGAEINRGAGGFDAQGTTP